MESCVDLYKGKATVAVLEFRWHVGHRALWQALAGRFPQKARVS